MCVYVCMSSIVDIVIPSLIIILFHLNHNIKDVCIKTNHSKIHKYDTNQRKSLVIKSNVSYVIYTIYKFFKDSSSKDTSLVKQKS